MSKWMVHLKKTMRMPANKGKKLGVVMKLAAKTYKKHKGGAGEGAEAAASEPAGVEVGADSAATAADVSGGRRRRSGKGRKTARRTRRR